MRPAAAILLAALCSCAFRTGHGRGDGPVRLEGQSVETATQDHDPQLDSGAGHHLHQAGEQSVCTEWLFTQPWASRGDWPRIAGDSAILLGLSLVVRLSTKITRR